MMVSLLLLAVTTAEGQEAFQATHIAMLSGGAEVSPTGSPGRGIAILRFDSTARTLEYRITVTGLGEPITAAHFHAGARGVGGPVLQAISFPAGPGMTATGTWNMDQEEVDSLKKGTIYINVHTASYPDGAIRGQVDPIPNARATLGGEYETPPVLATEGSGTAIMMIDAIARTVRYSVTWRGLSGPATAAHFHLGAIGEAGLAVHTIEFAEGDSSATGVWEGMTDQEFVALLADEVYINVHTAEHSEGEIRGQVHLIETYTAAISAAREVAEPPVSGSQAEGTGYVTLAHLSPDVLRLDGQFIVEGTTGPITAAHLHRGEVGVNGGVALALMPRADSLTQQWVFGDTSTLSAGDLTALRNSGLYANFHTEMYPSGEARGQLVGSAVNILPTVSAAPDRTLDPGRPKALLARVDRTTGEVIFTTGDEARGRVAVYSILGERVASVSVDERRARVGTAALPAGVYVAVLENAGRAEASCRVAIVR